MNPEEFECRFWSLDFSPDPEVQEPVELCSHPEGKGFCDFSDNPRACPMFKWEVPLHEVEIRQHLEMVE